MDRQTDGQTDRWTDSQPDKQTARQTDKQPTRLTELNIHEVDAGDIPAERTDSAAVAAADSKGALWGWPWVRTGAAEQTDKGADAAPKTCTVAGCDAAGPKPCTVASCVAAASERISKADFAMGDVTEAAKSRSAAAPLEGDAADVDTVAEDLMLCRAEGKGERLVD